MVIKIDRSSPASLRRTHRGLVLSKIQGHPGISRAELARALGFSDMAATRIIRELIVAGLVEEMEFAEEVSPSRKKRLGRPKIGLRICGDGLFAAGIIVSAYHSEVSISDANGRLRASRRIGYFVSDNIAETARHYGRALATLIRESGIDADRIVGVGIALAARTSLANGEIVTSDYFGWGPDGGAFRRQVHKIIGLPIEIDNISNALAIAEMRFGAARGASDFVLIHVATVIGAAVLSGKRLIRGQDGISGMIGHFRTGETPFRCVCGRSDCLNLWATGFGVLSRLGKAHGPSFDRTRLEDYAASLLKAAEDPDAGPMIAEAGGRLAPVLDNICKLLGPEMIILSGHLGTNENYVSGLRTEIYTAFQGSRTSQLPIVSGSISPTLAAPHMALHLLCYSDRLDFGRFAKDAGIGRSSEIGQPDG